jgi:predicted metal-dependent hydrolase
MLAEEESLLHDPRLAVALASFNVGDWYAAHDHFEELWHETQGPMRPALQGVLQIAVAHVHLERANLHGATVLLGEGIGRLGRVDADTLGLDFKALRDQAIDRLQRLQRGLPLDSCPPLRLYPAPAAPSVH